MALLDALAARLGYVRQPNATKAAVQLPAWMGGADAMWDDASFEAREDRQARMFARASWVNSAITFVAQQAASASLTVNRREGERLVGIENHPLELLLERPNPTDSRSQLMEGTFAFLKLSGNAFWWLNRSSEAAPPAEIWLIPPARIEAVSDGRLGVRGFLYDQGFGERIPLEPWEVVHFRTFNPLSQLRGLSPLESVEDTAETDLAQRRWNRNYFAKENAKVPGALAFADPIDESRWLKLKAEVREQWGGVRRSGPVLLRNVGAGGVQWVQMGLSQADMQFLDSRVANKEEIFSVFAPGLSSVLAVNATEANAIAGRRTFIELAVWPLLVAVAEKLTNSLLPAWGPGLQAAFHDIRPTDRAMQMAEQAAAERVLTIDELRQRFYELPPIGDDRGRMLPAQVSPALAMEEPETPSAPAPPGSPALEDIDEPALELERDDDQAEPVPLLEAEEEAEELATIAKAAELAQFRRWLRKKPGRDPAGFESRFLTAEEKALFAKLDESALRPNEEMQAEARRGLDWRAEYNRGGTAIGVARARDIVNNRALSPETWRRMASYFARHEVDKEAEGFRPGEPGYPSAGRIAWALWGGDAGQARAGSVVSRLDKQKAERSATEPASEEAAVGAAPHKARYENGADRERAALESAHADKLAEALRRWMRKALPSAAIEDADGRFAARLGEHQGLLRDALYVMLWEAALLGLEAADAQVSGSTAARKKAAEGVNSGESAVGINDEEAGPRGASSAATEPVKAEPIVSTAWDIANEAVIAWLLGATDYAGAVGFVDVLANQLVRTTIEQARPLVAAWMQNGLPLEHLIGQLEASAFSRTRAEAIATTEVTRAYSEGNMAMWRASGTVDGKRWETVDDEAVCPICGGLNQMVRGLDEPFTWEGSEWSGPPAHPRCRCNLAPVINVPQAGRGGEGD